MVMNTMRAIALATKFVIGGRVFATVKGTAPSARAR